MSDAKQLPLTEAQRQIMEIVWDRGDVTVSEVRDALGERGRDLARNTVQTMIVRLEKRGWLRHREEGQTYIYSADRPQTASLGARVAQMVDRLFGGSPEEMVTALIEYRGLSEEEAERIRDMIDEADTKWKRTTGQKRKPS
jgi:predicted transcriptional regulator